MQVNLEQFLKELQNEFLSGALDAVVQRFCRPLVVYTIAGVTVLRNHEEIRKQAEQYREAILALSVATSTVKIVSQEVVKNNRLRATARIIDFDADGREVTGSLIRYFLIKTANSYEIEMIEYLEAPLSTAEIERLVH